MNYFKEALKRGALGITVGTFIWQVIFCIEAYAYGIDGNVPERMVVDGLFIAGVLGFFMSAASVVFKVEWWSELKKLVIHFVILGGVFSIASILGKWMPEGVGPKIGYAAIFVLIYVCIWISFRVYWKARIREINGKLENKN
ncbi:MULTISPECIES: DUF3021 domain-containing protein [Clostridium]|uniref:DUF3021 domain-containing protein n=1 Tax=Clostridium TaxID=1485 RepID=UPI00069E0B62|nr:MULTISPECIES: DUF3021 domain-containing protein [Clostridium]KOF56831.1 hypothetical protein AGR56_09275 [Clostridium sp. DMHC 10]MCD2347779.1 DUF3021 domain-containing protein [Clostridium guangxiense]